MKTKNLILCQTKRLYLRALQEKDAKRLFTYRNQPEVSLFQGWTPETPEEVSNYAIEMQSRSPYQPGHWFQVALELTDSSQVNLNDKGNVVGDVAFCIDTETQKQAELGIALDSAFQGKGYAQEAVIALVDFLFDTLDLHRIHVSIDTENAASRKLCERIGFRQEAHLIQAVFFKGEWRDDIVMAMLKSEWVSHAKQAKEKQN